MSTASPNPPPATRRMLGTAGSPSPAEAPVLRTLTLGAHPLVAGTSEGVGTTAILILDAGAAGGETATMAPASTTVTLIGGDPHGVCCGGGASTTSAAVRAPVSIVSHPTEGHLGISLSAHSGITARCAASIEGAAG